MEELKDIIGLRRRELLVLWGLFVLWAFSQFIYRYGNLKAYDGQVVREYALGFTLYMIAPWAITILLALIGYVIGRSLIKLLVRGHEFRSDLEESTYSIGIGLGVISIVTFLLGLVHLLYPFIFVSLGIIVLFSGFRHLSHLTKVARRGLALRNWSILDLVLLFLFGVILFNSMFLVGNPSIGWDAMNSHLAAPKFYVREHAVQFYTWLNFNNFPQVQEMLYTIEMMALKDPGCALVYTFMVLSAVVTYLIGVRYFGRTVGLFAMVLLVLIVEIFRTSMTAYVEHLLIFYVLLLVHAFLGWYESGDRRWLILAGIAGGLACGVKYTGTESVLLVLILMVVARFFPLRPWERDRLPESTLLKGNETGSPPAENVGRNAGTGRNQMPVRRKSKRRKLSQANTAAGNTSNNATGEHGAKSIKEPEPLLAWEMKPSDLAKAIGLVLPWTAIFAAPWYIRNIVLFGNPFFPFFETIFGGLGLGTLNSMREQLRVDHAEMLGFFRYEFTLANVILLPWNFTMHYNHPGWSHQSPGSVGPFLLAFTPVLVFIRRWRRVGIFLAVYLVLFYSYWFLVEQLDYQRYVIIGYPLHCVLLAWGITEIFHIDTFDARKRKHLAWLFLGVTLAFGFFYRTTTPYTGSQLHFTEEDRKSNLAEILTGYPVFELINKQIAEGSSFFNEDTIIYGLAAENRRFYCDCPLIGGMFGYADHFEFMDHAATGRELFDYLDGLGCDYLIHSEDTAAKMAYAVDIKLPDDETFGEFFEQIAQAGDSHLYNLLSPGETRMTEPEEEPEESDPDSTDPE